MIARNTKDAPEVRSALAAGDMSGFRELYEAHRPRVYALCLRIARNPADAEDLAQEIFLVLHRKLATFRGEAAFSTWLYRLTVNHALLHLKKRRVRSKYVSEPGDLPEVADSRTDGRFGLVDRLTIDTAVGKLPAGYRSVFVLHDVEGFEHKEVAAILRCSSGTSRSQLHKARAKLRTLLTGVTKAQGSAYGV